jgi:RNA polymerase sigma factor (TIGR02999 family)
MSPAAPPIGNELPADARKSTGPPADAREIVEAPADAREIVGAPADAREIVGAPADARLVSQALAAAERGDLLATSALFTTLYRELHRLARKQLHAHAWGLTLGATTLLHEAYLDLSRRDAQFPDRARFFAYAAHAMRGLIIDCVRERRAIKRGGEFHITSLEGAGVAESLVADDLAPLAEALDELALAEPALAELVELKFFCGFGLVEIAQMRGISERTVQRDWAKARLFLRHAMQEE